MDHRSPNPHAERKTRQLCKQVARVVSSVLLESTEECLQKLSLLTVEPAAGTSVLRVAVMAGTANGTELSAQREALERLRPYLRGEVAQAVSRRRIPELVFALIPG